MNGSKRSALIYLVMGLFSVMMTTMATTAAARLSLQPLMVRRAPFAPRWFPVHACGIRVRASRLLRVLHSALACSRAPAALHALSWAPQPEPSAYVLVDRRAVDELCDDQPTSAPGLAAAIAERVMAVCASRIAADVSVDTAWQHATGDTEGAGASYVHA